MENLSGTNYFDLFGLAPRFAIDLNSLELSFRRLQAEVHPDRHASHTENEQRMALQLSTAVNDGYRTLRHPASRAQCLIGLAGKSGADASAAVAPAFLMAQMEWREAIEEARGASNAAALEALSRRLRHKVVVHEKELAVALDERGDFDAAAQRVNELRFYEKLRVEIDDALDRLDS
ncbi:Fe-S protein assembly co-chaperone HscB [Novimethylophilus sp.]|jgi:molecular chaperone HscB|uniref:Fe-S protein assembly co-chaperone HscB n=1 Tax=Novimethylophilus sp. TaxID=2137426 RepID=UPI002F3FEBA8